MPGLRRKADGQTTPKKHLPKREFVLSEAEQQVLKRIGQKVHAELAKREKPIEWLAFKIGVARSTLHDIVAGRTNPRALTLNAIATGLDYPSVVEFFHDIPKS